MESFPISQDNQPEDGIYSHIFRRDTFYGDTQSKLERRGTLAIRVRHPRPH